jgi:hypothetical protein
MPDINYKAVLEAENVKIEELPAKIQRKIAEYEKTLKHPFSYKKGTDELNPKSKEKLDDLNDDIITAIYEVDEDRSNTPPAKTPEELEAERLAAEEKAKKDKEAQAEIERKKAEKEAKRTEIERKNKHWTSTLYGEEDLPGDDE